MMSSDKPLEEESIRQDLEILTVSKPLVKSDSQKLKEKIHKTVEDEEEENARLKDMFWRKNTIKYLMDLANGTQKHILIPDDIMEMCLMRLPLTSLMRSHLVCKKWRYMATTQRFLQQRRENSFRTPWLFLFGALQNRSSTGEIHGYDLSQDRWHRIEADLLKGRFMYSVTSIHEELYIIGGVSRDRRSYKFHRGILVFRPLTKSWRKIASMKHSRSHPIVGTWEVTSEFSTILTQKNQQAERVGGESDPHKLSQNGNRNDRKRFVLIAIGGTGWLDDPLKSGEIYDSATDTWSEIQRLPMDFGVVSCGIICNGIFYVYSKKEKLSGYDIERGFWIGIQTSPIPSRIRDFHPKLVSCNQRLFMLSVLWCDQGDGEIGMRNKSVRKLLELDLVNLTWTEVSVHPDAPMDWEAAYVSDQNILMGVEMCTVFGQVLGFFTVCDMSRKEVSWRRVSRKQLIQKFTQSCTNKTIALLHL
ncbi:F-box/kelch-repeat protein [Cardamine amara subsp. amara]|uniref:F-box/kelch-repeat protein n=1 Tax=Cardamine amara subsp. amara TaxID=228776 RepID=A0ABD0Z3Q2_CARAN